MRKKQRTPRSFRISKAKQDALTRIGKGNFSAALHQAVDMLLEKHQVTVK